MLITVVLPAIAGLLAASAQAATLGSRQSVPSMMIVGDSISQGRTGDYTWRYRLWEWFNGEGVAVNFVGPYAGTAPQLPGQPRTPPPLAGARPASDPLSALERRLRSRCPPGLLWQRAALLRLGPPDGPGSGADRWDGEQLHPRLSSCRAGLQRCWLVH